MPRPDAPQIKVTRLTQSQLEDFVTNPLAQGEPALAYDTGALFIGTGTENKNITEAGSIAVPSGTFNGTVLTDTEDDLQKAIQALDDVLDGTISKNLTVAGTFTLSALSGNNAEVVTLDNNGKLQASGTTIADISGGAGGWNAETGYVRQTNISDSVVLGKNATPMTRYTHPDLVTNGAFATDTDWTKGTGWSIGSGVASCDGTQTADTELSQAIAITADNRYRVTFTLSGTTQWTGGGESILNILIRDDDSGEEYVPIVTGDCIRLDGAYYSKNLTYEFIITYPSYASGADAVLVFRSNENFIGSIDDVALRISYIASGIVPKTEHWGATDANTFTDLFSEGLRNGYNENPGEKRIARTLQFSNTTSEAGLRKSVAYGGFVADKFSNYPSWFIETRGQIRMRTNAWGSTWFGGDITVGDETLNRSIGGNFNLYRHKATVQQYFGNGFSGVSDYAFVYDTTGNLHAQNKDGSTNVWTCSQDSYMGVRNSDPAAILDVNGEIKLASAVTSGNGRIQYDGTFQANDEGWKEIPLCTSASSRVLDNYDMTNGIFDETNEFVLDTVQFGEGTRPNTRIPIDGLKDTYYANDGYGRIPFISAMLGNLEDIFRYNTTLANFEYYNGSSWVTWSGITETDYDGAFRGASSDEWVITETYANFRFEIDIPSWQHSHYLYVYQNWSNGDRTYTVDVEYWNGSAWVECATTSSHSETLLMLPFHTNPGSSTKLRVTFDVDGVVDAESKAFKIKTLQCYTARTGNTDYYPYTIDYRRNIGFSNDVSVGNDLDVTGDLDVSGVFTLPEMEISNSATTPMLTLRNTAEYPVLRFHGSEGGQPGNLGQFECYNDATADEVVAYMQFIRGDAAYNSGGFEFYVSDTVDLNSVASLNSILRMKGASGNRTFFDINVGQRDMDFRAYKSGSSNQWMTYDGGNDECTLGANKLAFYGGTPITKPSALTAEDTSTVDTTYGTEEADVIANLRTRVGELESKLVALGLLQA